MSTLAAAGPNAAIELRGVTKEFFPHWRGAPARALADVHFAATRGRVTALVGPNGSGKTTLLKICAGLTRPTAGTRAVEARGVGYVPDDPQFPGYLTARELLTRLARLFGVAGERVEAEVEAALDAVSLGGEAGRRIAAFSRGMRQRLALAQALLGAPALLLLDEPAAALDPRALARFATLIAAQRVAGRTVVFSSHFLPQVADIADDFVMLAAGRVIFRGDRSDVAARGGLAAIYLEAVPA